MVLDYYKLQEQPFGVTPDSRYLVLTPTHKEALDSLIYGIESGCGDANQDLAVAGLGIVPVLILQIFGGAVLVEHNCFHH